MKINLNEAELRKMLQPTMKSVAQSYDRSFAELSRKRQVQSLAETEKEVKAIFKKNGGHLPSSEARKYAKLIHEGKEIRFED